MRFGSSCLMLGALVRGLSTFPAYEAQISPNTKFWLTFTGHVILALGHPFLMTLSTKVGDDSLYALSSLSIIGLQVSQTWFGESERIVSTAAMAGSGAVGGMIGSILAPVIVNDNPANIPILQTVLPCIRNVDTNVETIDSFHHLMMTDGFFNTLHFCPTAAQFCGLCPGLGLGHRV